MTFSYVKVPFLGFYRPQIEPQMPLFYPVQAPEVLRMDSGKTEDVPDHFSTKNVHKKSYHILFHVHIIHINQILEKK